MTGRERRGSARRRSRRASVASGLEIVGSSAQNFATEHVLVEVKRAMEALITVTRTDANANSVFIQPRRKLIVLKAACERIDKGIKAIENKWPCDGGQ